MAVTFLVPGSQRSATVPDGWSERVALSWEMAVAEAVVEFDDGVELEPHAATNENTTATAVVNPVDGDLSVLVDILSSRRLSMGRGHHRGFPRTARR
ncbi:MAG TPA: hypothetical protein VMU34_13290 [Mycobacterium sp.]|nr:hypothetical protein [Mycobacterium sp.]